LEIIVWDIKGQAFYGQIQSGYKRALQNPICEILSEGSSLYLIAFVQIALKASRLINYSHKNVGPKSLPVEISHQYPGFFFL